jgi:hypothetical protein
MRKKINVLIKSDLLIKTNPIYICEKKILQISRLNYYLQKNLLN